MKKIVIALICLISLLVLASCATPGTGSDYHIPIDSDFTENSDWELKAYIDSYGLPTENKYVMAWSKIGVFSNSATNGSSCDAKLLINYRGEVEIVIYEYGSYVADSYSADYYTFTMMDSSENLVTKGTAVLTSRFTIDGVEAAQVIDALCKGGVYEFRIAGGKYVKSIYHVYFDGTGCANELSKLFPIAEPTLEE